MTGPDIVPVALNGLSTIVVEGSTTVDFWESGRILRQGMPASTYEVKQAVLYKLQCLESRIVEVFVAPASQETAMPHGRLSNGQLWGFMADLALNFDKFLELANCFQTRSLAMNHVLFSFRQIGFTRMNLPVAGESTASAKRGFTIPETARDMTSILGYLDHDFFLAWFLSVELKLPDATVTAKRAMLRIVAIAMSKGNVVDKNWLMENRRGPEGPSELARNLANRVASFFSMPEHLYLHGSVWVSLAAWHFAQCARPDLAASADSGFVEWPEVPGMLVSIPWSQVTFQILTWLNQKFNLDTRPGETAAPLHLSVSDCEVIQQAFVNTWLHKVVLIETVRPIHTQDNATGYAFDANDVASGLKSYMAPKAGETFRPAAAVGTPGTSPKWMVIAALDVYVNFQCALLYDNVVVLPFNLVNQWRNPENQIFLDVITYKWSCPGSNEGARYSQGTLV